MGGIKAMIFRLGLIAIFVNCFNYFSWSQQSDSISPVKVYTLGEVQIVSVKESKSISQATNFKYNIQDVSHSLKLLSSVSFINYGGKNESGVYVRGFDNRSVPVFIDGIPIYIPYDGFLDLGRFKTFDYAKIDVSKGFSPMAYGANTIGGAINLVSLKPQKKLEIQVYNGLSGGKAWQSGLNIGSKQGKYYIQGSYYHTQQEYFPLSGDFKSSQTEGGGHRDNSYFNEDKFNFKMGFSPNKANEYSVNYAFQTVRKGNPPYTGNDENIRARYWQWPKWDKQSIYFISNTVIDSYSALKVRLFYDKFDNELKSFDDNTYSIQTRPYTFTSIYDDYSLGGNMILSNEKLKNNKISLSAHFKQDHHKEHNLGEAVRSFIDNTMSFGADDVYEISNKLNLITGLSFNLRKNLKAEDYNAGDNSISEFPSNSNSALSAQMAIRYNFSNITYLNASIANKTRFATMKDRYSYRLGVAIPNPDLNSEGAMHYELSFNSLIGKNINIQSAIYYTKIRDAIQSVDNIMPGISQMQNTGIAEFYGGELTGAYKIFKSLNLSMNYSYIERNNLSRPDLRFTDVPAHQISGNISYSPFKYLEISALAEYNSKRYSTSYGTVADGFDIYHIFLSTHYSKVTLRTGIKNLFDKNYAYAEGYPEAGRNYFVTLLVVLNLPRTFEKNNH